MLKRENYGLTARQSLLNQLILIPETHTHEGYKAVEKFVSASGCLQLVWGDRWFVQMNLMAGHAGYSHCQVRRVTNKQQRSLAELRGSRKGWNV